MSVSLRTCIRICYATHLGRCHGCRGCPRLLTLRHIYITCYKPRRANRVADFKICCEGMLCTGCPEGPEVSLTTIEAFSALEVRGARLTPWGREGVSVCLCVRAATPFCRVVSCVMLCYVKPCGWAAPGCMVLCGVVRMSCDALPTWLVPAALRAVTSAVSSVSTYRWLPPARNTPQHNGT